LVENPGRKCASASPISSGTNRFSVICSRTTRGGIQIVSPRNRPATNTTSGRDDRRQQASPHLVARRQLHVENRAWRYSTSSTEPRRRAHEKQARHLRRLQRQNGAPAVTLEPRG
jgi:hypothetical protein